MAAVEEKAPKAPAKKGGARARQARQALVHRYLRYGIQLVFFILAPALFSGAFNGVKYLFTQIGAGQAIEPTAFLVQLVMVIVFTMVFGRFFCGFACAFGTLGDYLYNAFDFVRRHAELPRPEFPPVLVKVLSLLKYVVLAFVCAACFAGAWQDFSHDSPWVAFAAALSGSFEGVEEVAVVLLVLVMVGMVLRERFFCQFLCPLGAVFALLPVLGFSQFTRTKEHCAKKCGRCQQACPIDLWPDGGSIDQGECVSCGRCADVCPLSNVNMVAIEKQPERAEEAAPARPVRKSREAWRLLRGNEVAYTVLKACLLLVLCWLVGAARYVPPFVEVFGFNPLSFLA